MNLFFVVFAVRLQSFSGAKVSTPPNIAKNPGTSKGLFFVQISEKRILMLIFSWLYVVILNGQAKYAYLSKCIYKINFTCTLTVVTDDS